MMTDDRKKLDDLRSAYADAHGRAKRCVAEAFDALKAERLIREELTEAYRAARARVRLDAIGPAPWEMPGIGPDDFGEARMAFRLE